MKKVCELCKTEFDTILVIDGKKRNACNRKMCLACSPFNSGNKLTATSLALTEAGLLFCSKCKINKKAEMFYLNEDGSRKHSYCKSCQSANVLDRQRLWKKKAIAYKGGKCVMCSYQKYDGALEFHHTDPTQKEYGLSAGKLKTFLSSKDELDKCILVCSNCHREIHADLTQCP